MQKLNNLLRYIRRQPRWRLIVLAVVLGCAGLWWFKSAGKSAGAAATFAVRRGPLDITVLEGGSLQALESQEIKCEVRVGYQGTKILKIVEEGYFVTAEDVKTNKVLCELDSSDLQKQIVQQEIQYQSAAASLTDAEQNYEIQLGQNKSDIKDAEQKARFARMDFDKFLGDSITPKIVKDVGMDAFLAAVMNHNVEEITHFEKASDKNNPSPAAASDSRANAQFTAPSAAPVDQPVKLMLTGTPAPTPAAVPPSATTGSTVPEEADPPALIMPSTAKFDFSKYANIEVLGDGEAKQKLRKFEDDLQVAQKELGQASTALEGTRRLYAKGFVPKTEITRDEISDESARLKVQTAETAQALFLKYEFPRTAEETLSKYAEGVREFDKARRVAISKLAQAKAKLNSAKGQYDVQLRQRKDLNEQLEKCTMHATASGLVVYGSGHEEYYGNQEPMREGATARERQTIITIPNLTSMSVKVKIHESYIKKVKKGQQAHITVDAFPDQPITGAITKVGVLPDSQNRWMNPDLKVYLTTITIAGTNDWVKPGMSAKVEILVNHLDSVLYVPVQAITPDEGKQFCYVMNGSRTDRREVKIGEFTDEFIEVKEGLKEGERVLLRAPDGVEADRNSKENQPTEKAPAKPAAPAAQASIKVAH